MSEYRIVFDAACPESVYVRVLRAGTIEKYWVEGRKLRDYQDGNGEHESLQKMFDRARKTAETWIKDDKEARALAAEHNARS